MSVHTFPPAGGAGGSGSNPAPVAVLVPAGVTDLNVAPYPEKTFVTAHATSGLAIDVNTIPDLPVGGFFCFSDQSGAIRVPSTAIILRAPAGQTIDGGASLTLAGFLPWVILQKVSNASWTIIAVTAAFLPAYFPNDQVILAATNAAGSAQMELVRTDSSNNATWSRTVSGQARYRGQTIVLDARSFSALAGNIIVKINGTTLATFDEDSVGSNTWYLDFAASVRIRFTNAGQQACIESYATTPEGALDRPRGSLVLRTDVASPTLYTKTTASGSANGWSPVVAGTSLPPTVQLVTSGTASLAGPGNYAVVADSTAGAVTRNVDGAFAVGDTVTMVWRAGANDVVFGGTVEFGGTTGTYSFITNGHGVDDSVTFMKIDSGSNLWRIV